MRADPGDSDTAIFHSRTSSLLPNMVSKAVLQSGLPRSSVPALILGLSGGDPDQLAQIPGITPKIISAAAHALKEAYLKSFQSVWIAASCLAACGLIGRFTFPCSLTLLADNVGKPGSLFLVNPVKDLNNHIDNPAESEEALYGEK